MLNIYLPLLFAVVPVDPTGEKTIELPKDPDAVVIAFSYKGGFTPPRKNDLPNLTITAGGTVTVNDPFSDEQIESRIKPEQLQRLLRFIIRDNDFFGFEPAEVKKAADAEAKRRGNAAIIADAATTHLRVKTADKEHEAGYYALGFHANQFKDLKPLQQFQAIDRTLNHLRSVTWAGGDAAVAEFVEMANAELKEKFPDAEPLTEADLRHAGRRDGTISLHFHRNGEKQGTFVTVQIRKPKDGTATVTVNAKLR